VLYGIYGGYSECTVLPSNRRRPSLVYVSTWRPVTRDTELRDALVAELPQSAAFSHSTTHNASL
jgi:hypothetical protein